MTDIKIAIPSNNKPIKLQRFNGPNFLINLQYPNKYIVYDYDLFYISFLQQVQIKKQFYLPIII